jgi:SAM-dependent methyltransferase
MAEQSEWDARYSERERVWSGNPNGALVAEVAGLQPTRVLDVGCGEGADAVWLAARGWQVTALDVSQVAIDRGRRAAEAAGVEITWVHEGLVEAALPPESFDLVSAQYPALLRTPFGDAVHALLAAVAPGGALLLVHHADVDREHAIARGFDPEDYVSHEDVAVALGEGWQIERDERRPRVAPTAGAGAHHVDDLVLRARRTG